MGVADFVSIAAKHMSADDILSIIAQNSIKQAPSHVPSSTKVANLSSRDNNDVTEFKYSVCIGMIHSSTGARLVWHTIAFGKGWGFILSSSRVHRYDNQRGHGGGVTHSTNRIFIS